MGHTHYWTQRKNITALDWQEMQAAFVRILAKAKTEGLQICGPDGTGAPEFGSECLAFNGDETQDCSYQYVSYKGETKTYNQNGAHESFVIDRKRGKGYDGKVQSWTFCKTAKKPYDTVVTAIGCYLETVWPEYFEFTSDGDASEWQAGIALACRALPEKGNQMQIPGWVQDDERWAERGISGTRYGMHKHKVSGWVVVDQSKPMLACMFPVPMENVVSILGRFKARAYGRKEYTREANKLLSRLISLNMPQEDRTTPTHQSNVIGKMLVQFSSIANRQLARAA